MPRTRCGILLAYRASHCRRPTCFDNLSLQTLDGVGHQSERECRCEPRGIASLSFQSKVRRGVHSLTDPLAAHGDVRRM